MKISDQQTVILGAPGCGKTTALLSLVDQCFQQGIKPHEIAFVSFSRRAASEALERACDKFGFVRSQLPFFRTLHSLAFHQLGLLPTEVMSAANYNSLGDILRAPFTNFKKNATIEEMLDLHIEKKGDFMLFLDSLSRSRLESPHETFALFHDHKITKHEFIRFYDTYQEYRHHNGLIDFTDMLVRFVQEHIAINVKVAFIDEAQDLSRLQWEVCLSAFRNCERVVIAGDDDQAIFKWAGADAASFLNLDGTKVVLSKSHRLPRKIHAFAKEIITPVKQRYVKEFSSRDEDGVVKRYREIEHIPLTNEGSWLWLSRNTKHLVVIESWLRRNRLLYITKSGSSVNQEHVKAILTWTALNDNKLVPVEDAQLCLSYIKKSKRLTKAFMTEHKQVGIDDLVNAAKIKKGEIWHDALTGISLLTREYYLSVLRANRSLTEKPKHIISTIHGAKGMEADTVVLLSVMGKNTHDAYLKDADDERRVFYVGATRAKKELLIVNNDDLRAFKLPYV